MMKINNDNYIPRIMDKIIQKLLKIAGAICVEGPKWCGKTWTSRQNSNSEFLVGSAANAFSNRQLAILNPEYVLKGEFPRMIDEWQEVPSLWDATREEVDKYSQNGLFILTGSSTPTHKGVLHSGAGRIVRLRMNTMTLFESGDSTGILSLKDLLLDEIKTEYVDELDFKKLAYLIVRGGWPKNIKTSFDDCEVLPRSYIDSILESKLLDENNNAYNSNYIKLILKSLARNVSTTVSERSIINDISQNEVDSISRPTLSKYLDFLNNMFLFSNLESYSLNPRSSLRVKQQEKKYFCDPSLACALLDLTPNKIMSDLNLYGLLFEGLVIRDLKVYAQANEAKIYHYQDYLDNELDAVIEFKNGEWCAIEIKLGLNQVEQAAKQLNKAIDAITRSKNKPPINKCIIVGFGNLVYKRKEDGIIVIPINALKD
ncbi:ATP-binding protein [Mycoplasma leachii]|uniref:ATP-binding protein n=1 Tax=Mycoplasma leachii TaxID=2105 RepID=UPI003DA5BD5F